MDGHFNLCGARRVPLKAHGKEYFLTVRQLKDYALKEAAILSKMGNPYAGVEFIKDDARLAQVLKVVADVAARPQIASFQDEERFDQSMRGLSYNIWRCLSVEHPDEFPPGVPLEKGIQLGADFIEWFGQDRVSELIDAIWKANEADIVKNSDGQTVNAQ